MSDVTVFITPKPFTHPHIAIIQKNALRSWQALGLDVVLVGDDEGVAEAAQSIGAVHCPDVKRNDQGTPLISSIFDLARQASQTPMLAYVNADVILLPDFEKTARELMGLRKHFLAVGQRWDMAITEELDFSAGWDLRLISRVENEGRLHPRGGSDYFIYPRECFEHIPDFAIGRAGWDNWMFYEARRQRWPLIDCTRSIQIIHQDHDYSHLPGGQAHYRLPESFENVRLGGGRRTIFTLGDVNHVYAEGKMSRPPLTGEKLRREVEIFPLVVLRSMALGHLFFALFHPIKAYREFRAWLNKKIKG